MPLTGAIEISTDPQRLAERAADLFLNHTRRALAQRGSCYVALSGGSTPKRLFRHLTEARYRNAIDWTRVHFFFGDERYVPADHADSNFRMAHENLFAPLEIIASNVHRVLTELGDPQKTATQYEDELKRRITSDGLSCPRFDIVFLGMGTDGHTASLFPDTNALAIRDRCVTEVYVPKLESWRITLTFPAINAARAVLILIEGDSKADVLRAISSESAARYPIQSVNPRNGELIWLCDRAAAQKLS